MPCFCHREHTSYDDSAERLLSDREETAAAVSSAARAAPTLTLLPLVGHSVAPAGLAGCCVSVELVRWVESTRD